MTTIFRERLFSKSVWLTIPALIFSNDIKVIYLFSCQRDNKFILPSENLLYLIPWGWMLRGLSALFLKWTLMVSPTSAYKVGPRSPKEGYVWNCLYSRSWKTYRRIYRKAPAWFLSLPLILTLACFSWTWLDLLTFASLLSHHHYGLPCKNWKANP